MARHQHDGRRRWAGPDSLKHVEATGVRQLLVEQDDIDVVERLECLSPGADLPGRTVTMCLQDMLN